MKKPIGQVQKELNPVFVQMVEGDSNDSRWTKKPLQYHIFPCELGKPLYIQNIDLRSEFQRRVGRKFFTLLFPLFASGGVAVLMFIGAFAYGHIEYLLFALLFS